MFQYNFSKKPTVEGSNPVNVSVFIRSNLPRFLQQWSEWSDYPFDFTNESSINLLIQLIEESVTINLRQELNGKVEVSPENKVKLAYTKSNLGRGYIFWFVCQLCNRKVRFLYTPCFTHIQACRKCHKLIYNSQKSNDSKLFKRFMRRLG